MKTIALVMMVGLLGVHSRADSSKPKYGPEAKRLVLDHSYLKMREAPDYWALSSYYLPQQDGRSCSVASFAMAINALKAHNDLGADDMLVTQKDFMKRLADEPSIKRFFSDKGRSISLDEFSGVAKKALEVYGIKNYQVEVLHVDKLDLATETRLKDMLSKNEKSPRDIILANFLQSELTGDPEGKVGHVAPVAAYDGKLDRVLIMDPDREYYEPYWVSVKTFMKGLNTLDQDAGKNRGILWIHP
jgi:hypothetical protein